MPAQHGVAVVLTDQRIRGDRHVHVHADLGGVLEEPDQGIGAALIQGAVGTLAVGIRAVVLLGQGGEPLEEHLRMLQAQPGGDISHAVPGREDRHPTAVHGFFAEDVPGIAVAGQFDQIPAQFVGGVGLRVGDRIAFHLRARQPVEPLQALHDQQPLALIDEPVVHRTPHHRPAHQGDRITEQMIRRPPRHPQHHRHLIRGPVHPIPRGMNPLLHHRDQRRPTGLRATNRLLRLQQLIDQRIILQTTRMLHHRPQRRRQRGRNLAHTPIIERRYDTNQSLRRSGDQTNPRSTIHVQDTCCTQDTPHLSSRLPPSRADHNLCP